MIYLKNILLTIFSVMVAINVCQANLTISFAKPLNGASFNVGDDIEVTVNANDNSLVSNIKLYINNQFIRKENYAPYEWSVGNQNDPLLQNMTAGSYTLKAIAQKIGGGTVQKTVNITVSNNLSISFAEPLNGTNFNVGDDIEVIVNANDNSLVSNIKLYVNNQFVRQENGAPYEWSVGNQNDPLLQNMSAGSYTLKAVAQKIGGGNIQKSIAITVSGSPISVTLSNFPEDLQFYARNVQNNKATVPISGTVQMGTVNSMKIDILKNGQFYSQKNISLSGNNFSTNVKIDAELSEYTFKLYAISGSNSTLIKETQRVVAGDAYIITGQSNSVARGFNGSAAENNSDFIRVFGSGTSNSNTLLNNAEWFIGQGDGTSTTIANTGQWGLRLAKQIIDNHSVPVCIFNGGDGGKEISFFEKNNGDPEDLTTNYGRLLYRLNQTNLANKVRAIFWYQGESDASKSTGFQVYKGAFTNLHSNWLNDYPSTEHTYITQIRDGCSANAQKNVIIQEALRQLGEEIPNSSVMSTKGLAHDGCHFPYENGYKVLGQRYYRLLSRDLYGENVSGATSPDIAIAYFSASNEITIQTKTNDNLIWESGASALFQLEGTSVRVVSGKTQGNKVILQLSGNGANATGITYLDQRGSTGDYVISPEGHGMLSFYNFPISQSNPIVELFQHCNYGGIRLDLGVGEYPNLSGLALGGNRISSLKVPTGLQVTLYNGTNFSGSSITFTANDVCLSNNNFNDKASSLKVEPIGVDDRSSSQSLVLSPEFGPKTQVYWVFQQEAYKKVKQFTVLHGVSEEAPLKEAGVVLADDNLGFSTYKFLHHDAQAGKNHYQIKVEYEDGSVFYPMWDDISFKISPISLTIAPNPAADYLKVDVSKYMSKKIQYSISTIQGIVVVNGIVEANHNRTIELDLTALKNGMYILHLRPENHRAIATKFMVGKDY